MSKQVTMSEFKVESLSLSDEKILEIASNPMVTPCSPWWLKDDVKAGDVQNATIAFARAVLKAAAPDVQGEPLGYVVPRMAARLGKGELCGISVLDKPEDGHALPVYLAPQPTEQQPELAKYQLRERAEF